MADNAMAQGPAWQAGTPVRVRNRFDRRWTSGFEIESSRDAEDHGRSLYLLRRRSDGSTLPVTFGEDELGPDD